MEEKKEKIKEIIRIYFDGYDVELPSDFLIDVKIDEQIQYVFNFCNIDELPDALIHTVAMRCVGELLSITFVTPSSDNEEMEGVKQITEGDTTISFSNASENLTIEQIKAYKEYGKHNLMNFRKVKWL